MIDGMGMKEQKTKTKTKICLSQQFRAKANIQYLE